MRRVPTALALLLAAGVAQAHFVYVVPQKDAKTVHVVFSDSLDPDENVDIGKVAGLKLTGRFLDGKTAPVELKKADHHLAGELGLIDPRCVYGSVEYGVMQKGDAKPYLLAYHPKAVLAGCDEKLATVGAAAPLEIVPTSGGRTALRVLAAGKPVADAEVTVMTPDGKKTKVKTDKDGLTPTFDQTGRYGAWAKHTEAKVGELGGKKYEEVRHYATLVFDAPTAKGK